MRPLRIFLCAGEASGDLHAGAVAAAIRKIEPDVEIEGVGGESMREAGVELLHTIDEFAVLGISEVVSRLPFFMRALKDFENRFRFSKYDLVIPVDFPDFNIRLAARAKKAGLPVLYYISPQVWAWRRGRVKTLARVVDRMIVVFPFETALYEAAGVPVEFVGHPLLEHMQMSRPPDDVRTAMELPAGAKLVALLPGSRIQEVERILPSLAKAATRLAADGITSIVSRARSVPEPVIRHVLEGAGSPSLPIWDGAPTDLVAAADFAIVASGTATLETGLIGTPLLVVYRMAPLSWIVAKSLVRMPYIGLVNIAAGRKIAPELLQDDVTGDNVARIVREHLGDPQRLAAMRRDLAVLHQRLGGPGASERTARAALDMARKRRNA